MGSAVRGLLLQGNQKLGAAIHHFDLEAVTTCPGSTELCRKACYCNGRGRYAFPVVLQRLRANLEASRRADFVDRVVDECRRKGVLVLRAHCSGDYYDAGYARKWLSVMKRCPRVTFYWYTRSWRVPEIAVVLAEMARLRQCRGWYSIDAETGLPEAVPRGIRLAYLQAEDGDRPEQVDLFFRVRRLRRTRIPLSLVCPSETPNGRNAGVTCGSCRRCFA
ncbi:MAG: hypothetical protein U0871_04710 [Gemmataceae bacterium]